MASSFDYLENLMTRNPGIYLSEKDYSIYNVTQFYNRLTLVVGCSRVGLPNLPVLLISPENADDIYGKQDMHLERRNSYFHRAIKDMLAESPVIALNLRLHDDNLDKYNWINISTSTDSWNSNTKSRSITDFYNIADGFWRRRTDEFLDVVRTDSPYADSNPLNFVNQKEKPVSILLFKSELGGFDVPAEDWYNGKVPEFLHPKDYVSDYMVQVIALEGKWNNYEDLSKSVTYSRYFSTTGIRKERLEEFLNLSTVKMLKRWNCSLIPYFTDRTGRDIWIQSVVNNDVNETGIYCAFDTEIIETEYKNGFMDLLGDNLTGNKKPQLDFLSYKRYMTDFFVLEETLLDSPKNAFGNPDLNSHGRTQIYSEGYIHGVKMKTVLISSTTTIEIRPFDTDSEDEAYGVINGIVIPINSDINDFVALNNVLVPGAHRAYLVLLTTSGIVFRMGGINPLEDNMFLPQIDATKEIVLGYYEFAQDEFLNYYTKFYPGALDGNGFINPFRKTSDDLSDVKISNKPVDYDWMLELYFEGCSFPNPQNYEQMRIYHLWYWLSSNIQEFKSLVIDTNGSKQPIEWVEGGDDGSGKFIKIATSDKTSNIKDTYGTLGMVSIYIKDIETLNKNNRLEYSKPPLEFGTKGLIGYESFIKESYLKGFINSGDPFFWSFSEETGVVFTYASDINQNLILIQDSDNANLYSDRKVVVEGSKYNDGIWNLLGVIDYKGTPAIVVQETVIEETVSGIITFYDARYPYIIDLYEKNNNVVAILNIWDGSPEELYERLKDKDPRSVWARTIEIKNTLSENKLVVDWNRYAPIMEKGKFLLSETKKFTEDSREKSRNWTRIVDLQRLDDNNLLVVTDSPVKWRMVDDTLQTDMLVPVWEWVDTLDFKVLEGFKPREDVFPDGSDERMKKILELLAPGTRMLDSLSGDKFEWRYLIDSFGGGLYEESKMELANLCEKKQFAMGFLNTPSIKKGFLKDGTKYSTDGFFDSKKFISGGDRKSNVGASYSLSRKGSSHVAYLAPWVAVSNGNRFEIVPPASHVGQVFMRKHNDARKLPWTVLAGVQNSRVSTVLGLETVFDDDTLNDLHNYGITCLNTFGDNYFYVFNEKTGARENSLLRFIHNREALIEIEMSMYRGLLDFQWSFFSKDLKKNVEKFANDICDYYKKNDAIQAYTNRFVMDNQLIDAQIGLLETSVEMTGAMQTILLRVSVLKTGGISILFG